MPNIKIRNFIFQNTADRLNDSYFETEYISRRSNPTQFLCKGVKCFVLTGLVALLFIGQGQAFAAATVKEIQDPVSQV